MRQLTYSSQLGTILVFALSACSSDPGIVSDPGPDVATTQQGLEQATSCDDLLGRIQADALAKLDAQVEELKEADLTDPGQVYGPVGSMRGDVALDVETSAGAVGSDGAVPILAPSAAPSTTTQGSSNSSEEEEASYSETNQQVAGVDEADIVKTDGQRVYLLHGTDLIVLDAAPPSSTAVALQTGLEGAPLEMFVHDGKVLVYSSVADPDSASSSAKCVDGSCLYAEPAYYYGGNFTKLTLLDTAGDAVVVLGETYVEGSYVSSRMHGSLTRGVVQGGFKAPDLYNPDVEIYDAFGNLYEDAVIDAQIDDWRERTAAAISATELSDWLPRRYAKVSGALQPLDPECTQYYVPAPGATQFGQTSIETLDLAASDQRIPGVIVLGEASQVYANQQVLLLAQSDYWWWAGIEEEQRTRLHLFEIDGTQTPYVASGQAPGVIHDQFSLDERDGIVRLSTTQESWNESGAQRKNQVVTLETVGETLKVLGQSPALAPGETIYSTRFVGDIAYVVTFRQMDPLFAVDLSDPAEPTLLGELEIPGFSDYMHPLDDTHLLTIGRNVDPVTLMDTGLLLQIFDVSDPTSPAQAFSYTFSREGWSEANSNHKAFTYYEQKNLLAFPFVSYSSYPTTSTLELVRVGLETGFEPVGSIDHSAFVENSCTGYDDGSGSIYYECAYSPEVRRGLFIEDAVYSISYGGVLVHSIDDLSVPLASVALPAPNLSMAYGGVVSPGMPIAVGVGGGTAVAVEDDPAPDAGAGAASSGGATSSTTPAPAAGAASATGTGGASSE